MAATLAAVPPEPGCCESLGEIAGVEFVNDARSTSPLTLQAAIQAARPGRRGEPNVLLIAGGRDQELDFHDLGPLLSQRVKRAFLLDGAAPRLRAAWSLFTPCAVVSSLLEAVRNAFDAAAVGDVVLFSPACFDSDTFPTPPHRGAAFRRAVGEFRDNPGPRRPTVPGPDPDGRPDLRAAESMPFVTFAHTDQQRPDR
jgi:UDP-N-acetylmuramoylalanine--D-glutamate ligase